jgi:hypothetical protein
MFILPSLFQILYFPCCVPYLYDNCGFGPILDILQAYILTPGESDFLSCVARTCVLYCSHEHYLGRRINIQPLAHALVA